MKKWSFLGSLLLALLPSLSAQRISTEAYIAQWKDMAVSEMKRSGIPASITLAQGILESSSGNSTLAVKYNNHFGIKCHDWEGNRAYHDDDEKNECFRHYEKAEDSFRDHSDFLMSHKRYASLFDYQSDDYVSWAKGLRKAGYATATDYPQRLMALIERYNLHIYDVGGESHGTKAKEKSKGRETRVHSPKPKVTPDNFTVSLEKYPVKTNNRTEYIVAKAGDTYSSLTLDLDFMPWQLPKYNDAPADKPLVEGEVVYIEPKRRRAERGKNTHRLREGETMRNVSQLYAVKLSRLYYFNGLEEGSEPKTGTVLNLRKKKKIK